MSRIYRFQYWIFLAVYLSAYINLGCSADKNAYKTYQEKITLVKNDTLIQFYVAADNKQKLYTPSDSKYYTWYGTENIHITEGAFSGKLLHGSYLELYPNRTLKLKGGYNKGLKNGKWQSWYQSGESESVISWKDGLKNGEFRYYDDKGKLREEGYYKSDMKDGQFSTFLPDGKIRQAIFRQGVVIKDTLILVK